MVDYKVIGLRLKTYRQQAGLTQETVAERAGITVVYLSKIENGHVRPTIDLLQTVCEAVHCDLGSIFRDLSRKHPAGCLCVYFGSPLCLVPGNGR